MRHRNREIIIWLTDDEYSCLKKNVAKTGLTIQAYFRCLMRNIQPKEQPPVEFQEVLKNLRQINLNMNQIAVKANAIGFIDTAEYWKNVDAVQAAISEIKEAVRN